MIDFAPTSPRSSLWSLFQYGMVAVCLLLILVTATGYWLWLQLPTLPAGVTSAEYVLARQKIQELYSRHADHEDILALIAEQAVNQAADDKALACLAQIPKDHAIHGLSSRLQEGQLFLERKDALAAEVAFRNYVDVALQRPKQSTADLLTACNWLEYLLSMELRLEDRKPLLAEMHKLGLAQTHHSKLYFFPTLTPDLYQGRLLQVNLYHAVAPEAPWLQIAQARYETSEGKVDRAAATLSRLIEQLRNNPTSKEYLHAVAGLLHVHFYKIDWGAFRSTMQLLPAASTPAAEEPWLLTELRGQLAFHEENWQAAIRYFQTVQQHDPANPIVSMGLARAFEKLGDTQSQNQALERAHALGQIRVILDNVTEYDSQVAEDVSNLCKQAGLIEAATVFQAHARRIKQSQAMQ